MTRRKTLASLAAAAGAATVPPKARAAGSAIQLHLDLEVDPAKEAEMLANFKKQFQPTISKQPGFVDVKLLKFRQAMAGTAPAKSQYRLLISFQTEEARKAWVARDEHQRVWPLIEKTLTGSKYNALLYDVV
jgi:heme-degrading monooxygenase HmoA